MRIARLELSLAAIAVRPPLVGLVVVLAVIFVSAGDFLRFGLLLLTRDFIDSRRLRLLQLRIVGFVCGDFPVHINLLQVN